MDAFVVANWLLLKLQEAGVITEVVSNRAQAKLLEEIKDTVHEENNSAA